MTLKKLNFFSFFINIRKSARVEHSRSFGESRVYLEFPIEVRQRASFIHIYAYTRICYNRSCKKRERESAGEGGAEKEEMPAKIRFIYKTFYLPIKFGPKCLD